MARSLMLEPEVLFFDEPSAALDVRTSETLASLLTELNKQIQIVIVSHDIPFLEKIGGRGCVMEKGSLKKVGELADLVHHLRH
ncbi:MAG: hypothetical protein R3B54_09975 [Bdellovibrionota bacterium]